MSNNQQQSTTSSQQHQRSISSPNVAIVDVNDDFKNSLASTTTSSNNNMNSTTSDETPSSMSPLQQQTPLPKKIFFPLILALFMESISYVTPMPFMGNYVSHLTNHPIVESGRYSGIIVGCFYGGTILSGSWWGRISDQFGRKPVLIFGLAVSGFLEMIFGLAPNIWICFMIRLLQGLFNGMQATSKTVIAESTDSTNEALGFSLMSLAWSGGTFIGMANGGWLYGVGDPHFFGMSFPAFLPCFTMSMFAFFSVTVIWWQLPETNPRTIPLTWSSLKEFLLNGGIVTSQNYGNNNNHNGNGANSNNSSNNNDDNDDVASKNSSSPISPSLGSAGVLDKKDEDGLLAVKKRGGDNNSSSHSSNNNHLSNNSISAKDSKKQDTNDFTFAKMWSIPLLKAALVDYLLLSAHEIAFDEVFPLLAVSPDSVAGLAMTVSEVGLTIMYAGFFMIVSVYAFPIVRRMYGDMVYVYASAVLSFCYVAIPQGELYMQGGTHKFVPIALLIPLRTWANDFCYSQALLMIPRSAPSEHIGTVTSMSTTAAACARLMVPPIASALFSFSVTEAVGFYPYNSTLTFACCSILAAAGAIHRRGWIARGMVTTNPVVSSSSSSNNNNNNNNGGGTSMV